MKAQKTIVLMILKNYQILEFFSMMIKKICRSMNLLIVFDNSPLGFENGQSDEIGKFDAQDPHEDVDLAKD